MTERPEPDCSFFSMATPAQTARTAHVAQHVTVLEEHDRVYLRLDAAGRWTGLTDPTGTYRRSLGGEVLRHASARFVALPSSATPNIHGAAHAQLLAFERAIGAGLVEVLGDGSLLPSRLQQARRWDPVAMAAHEEALRAAWPEPTRILPPHRYRDLVLLPATGCPNHRCGFCAFYRERPFRLLDAPAFDAHLQAVVDVLGPALDERDGIFLGSASALSVRDELLLDRLERVRRRLGTCRRGVAAFLDPDRAPRRAAADWSRLRSAGLVEATLGLETGLTDLRAAAGKQADLADLIGQVDAMHAGGVRVGLTILVGLGGALREEEHRAATVEVLRGLDLTDEDHVHLSPLVPGVGLEERPDLLPTWRDEVASVTPARIAPYRVERFAWLT